MYFSQEGVFNHHNTYLWDHENSHCVRPHDAQHRFSEFFDWFGRWPLNRGLPVAIHMTLEKYHIFLDHDLPGFLEVVPENVRRNMWFQNNAVPPHYGLCVIQYLTTFVWSTMDWAWCTSCLAPRLSGFKQPGYFSLGALKYIVCETPVYFEMDLVASNISSALLLLSKRIQVFFTMFTNPWSGGVTHAWIVTVETSNISCNIKKWNKCFLRNLCLVSFHFLYLCYRFPWRFQSWFQMQFWIVLMFSPFSLRLYLY